MNKVKIKKHYYDNPVDKNGKLKENEIIGEFFMTKEMEGNMEGYSFKTYGFKDNDIWVIIGKEVSGMYGCEEAGTKCRAYRLSEDEIVKTYLQYHEIAKKLKYE